MHEVHDADSHHHNAEVFEEIVHRVAALVLVCQRSGGAINRQYRDQDRMKTTARSRDRLADID